MTGVFEKPFLSVERAIYGPAKKSASWIKQNMIGSPPKRVPTEAEVRVQRALQKLDIPDWYLNKKSKAPKILKNDTPIDYREPSWKRGVRPEIMSASSSGNPNTSDSNGVCKLSTRYNTSMNESLLSRPYVTPRVLEKSSTINENNASSTAVYEISEVDETGIENPKPNEVLESGATDSKINETFVISSRASLSLNKSSTFPKISPSRKVQNINIVFPPTKPSPKPSSSKSRPPALPLEANFETDLNSNLIPVSKKCEQMAKSFENTLSRDEKFSTPKKMKVSLSASFNSSFVNAISPKPFSKKVVTPSASPACNFNFPSNSTSIGNEATPFISALDKPTPPSTSGLRGGTERILNLSRDSDASKALFSRRFLKKNKDSEYKQLAYWLGEVKPFGPDCPEVCQECGKKAPKIYAAVTTSTPKNTEQAFNEKYVSPKIEKMPEATTIPTTSTASMADYDNMEKEIDYGNNLAEEIIQGLKDKCKRRTSYTLLGTKYFVNRLVNDLGGENLTEVTSEEEDESSDSDNELNSEGSMSLNSMSFKASEPESVCGIVTSTLKSNIGKSRIKKIKNPLKTNSAPPADEEVFWIPIKMPNSGRPGSSRSVKSKCSGSETEGGVLDSGYSDRSSAKKTAGSPSSLSDESWVEDRLPSPIESDISFTIQPNRHRVLLGKKKGVYVL